MKIKVVEEDFRVEEIASFDFKDFNEIEGQTYGCFLLTKKRRNTSEVISEVARRLRIKTRSVGFAGNKDRIAITKQFISIPLDSEEEVSNVTGLEINEVSLIFKGWIDERITLGSLVGNKFEVIVRGLENEREIEVGKVKNFFGEQRFGTNNIDVGRALVKNDFEEASKLIGLEVDDRNFVNALRGLDSRQSRFYVSAYQSWLWNEVAEKIDNVDCLELIGFLTEFEDEVVSKHYSGLLLKEGISKEGFMIKQLKEASLEGSKRKLFLDVKNFSYEWGVDEILEGKKKCKLLFELSKGCYATVLVDSLFGPTWKSI
ncbi:tRNA pseudouridine(13) synthase TruD [Candidatus Woesearchaeota archaeon]|jgi:tRNA(Glu) U13 pseudouridine synthase TruD|nr:tRNA pseudouridine(13) synthase TruD [Candidatus Woesearchaeota archaeon]MBT6044548.1 tRNA pseudouridine(13) synthase TruD [Candidatus Woesearchaeota archaeon]